MSSGDKALLAFLLGLFIGFVVGHVRAVIGERNWLRARIREARDHLLRFEE